MQVAEQRNTLKTQSQAQAEALDYILKRRSGEISSLRTPWNKWNNMHIDGIESGRIITVAGMSSSGKSAIGNQLNSEIHGLNPEADFAILNFNFEMTSKEILIRHVISTLGISNKQLLSAGGVQLGDQEVARVRVLLDATQANADIFYCEYPKTVEEYKLICRKFADKYRKKFIVETDHSVLFKKGISEDSATSMLYNLGDAAIEIKKDIDCTQIHFSQLNREIEDPKRRLAGSGLNYPSKTDIFGGDALYQCADTVLINHRPYLLNFKMNTYGPDKFSTAPTDIYWHFLKLRQGDPGIAHMTADFSRFRFTDKF